MTFGAWFGRVFGQWFGGESEPTTHDNLGGGWRRHYPQARPPDRRVQLLAEDEIALAAIAAFLTIRANQ